LSATGTRLPLCVAAVMAGLLGVASFASGSSSEADQFDFGIKPGKPPKHDFVPVRLADLLDLRDPAAPDAFPRQPQAIVQKFDDSLKWKPSTKHHCERSEIAGTTSSEALDACRSSVVGGGLTGIEFDPTGDPQDYYGFAAQVLLFNGPRVNGDPTWLVHIWGPVNVKRKSARRGDPDFYTYVWRATVSGVDKPDLGTKATIEVKDITRPDPGAPLFFELAFRPDASGGTWKARCDDSDGQLDAVTELPYPDETLTFSAHKGCRE
jgi:hypothetical protein